MSRVTPSRRPKHIRHPSNRIPAISDYESDIAPLQSAYEAPPPRSNTELNLSVLQRYLPSIRRIVSIAANAVIYTFDTTTEGWEKSGIEGTMFVCAQSSLSDDDSNNNNNGDDSNIQRDDSRPRACVFVLNRRGLDNVIVDLARVSHVEIAGELVILKVEGTWNESEKVLGVWIHNDEEATRATNGAIIQESWRVARAARSARREGPEAGPAMQAIGRPLSIYDLFAKQNAG